MVTPEAGRDESRVVGADRVLAVLIELGGHPQGTTLDELAQVMRSPKPTVHRALTSLRKVGLATQIRRGTYALGDEFFRLAFRNFAERPETMLITPILEELSQRYGETAHYAVLDGAEVVYRAKTDPPGGAVRLTSVVGGRNPAYRTAVGKLLLSRHVDSEAELRELLGTEPLDERTPQTITDMGRLWSELQLVRERGFAVDDQENEVGVNCVAVPVYPVPGAAASGAVSVSALAFRLPLADLVQEVPTIIGIVEGGPRTAG
ncbi:IclR family transcriptional regulator [Nocardiopsis sp. CNS-639]|uniref:IclR family transcriptional regulator n=1 Tax=Nocardiopsis sp. CNS-639 TaxID=1169153 RepID=UPI00037E0F9D|nr:IclR family transcriptional regulator [Nocardiopsis sp. CNS-639]